MSTSFRLLLPRQFYNEMVAQAQAELPNECCGLLAGTVNAGTAHARARFPLINELASPTEFQSEPRSLFQAHKEIRKQGWEILAIYHSHPTSPPLPSRKDRERNFSEGVMNLILSLNDSQPLLMGWWLTAENYTPADWTVQ